MSLSNGSPTITSLGNVPAPAGLAAVANMVWDPGALLWVKETQSGGGGGGAVTIADGADVAEGATTDVAVFGNVAGTVSAKLRGINTILNDVWDSVGHWLRVQIQGTVTVTGTVAATQSGAWTVTANQGGAPWSFNETQIGGSAYTLGQKTMALSAPVVIASDQSAISTTDTPAADQIVTGTITAAGQTVVFTPSTPDATIFIQVTGLSAAGGGLQLEATVDAVTWFTIQGYTPQAGQMSSGMTGDGLMIAPIAGSQLRLRCTFIGAGTITIQARISKLANFQYALLGNFTTVEVTQGPGFAAPDWTFQLNRMFLDDGLGGSIDIIAGQQTMANSVPVTIASNQSAIPITTSSPLNVTVGSLPPPAVETNELLRQILTEMRTLSYYVSVGLNVTDDLERVRQATNTPALSLSSIN